ncbi:MAG: peptidylprolyl isomerase [Candidatus Thalassarchaeaceae archaeon]
MVGGLMPTGPSSLKDALSRATSMIESGDVDGALELLRTEAWAAAENNSHKVQVISLAAEAKIAKGDIDMANRKAHWQDAHNSYQRAQKLEPSNKEIRRAQNKLASMMDEQSISLGKGWQLFDDGNPTPTGLAAAFVGLMVFLVAFKFAGEWLEEPLVGPEVTLEVRYITSYNEADWGSGIDCLYLEDLPSVPDGFVYCYYVDDDSDSEPEQVLVEGEIVIQLYASEAPKHVENFLYLVDNGMYDSTIFHRIIDGFMIQGGDIDDMNGAGGYAGIWYGYCNGQISGSNGEIYTSENCPRSDWTVPDEADNGLLHEPSVIAMAKTSAPNTGGSQFYIVPTDSTPSHLDGVHTVFGKVTSGMNHVDAISEVSTGSNDKPVEDVRLIQAYRS